MNSKTFIRRATFIKGQKKFEGFAEVNSVIIAKKKGS